MCASQDKSDYVGLYTQLCMQLTRGDSVHELDVSLGDEANTALEDSTSRSTVFCPCAAISSIARYSETIALISLLAWLGLRVILSH